MDTTNPPFETYQLVLRRAFLATGAPRQISFDRGAVFFDNTTTSPFPTRLHLWLIALGVEVSFTRIRRPTDHAHVERVHQTMTLQALLGQSWSDATALWAGLDARRTMLNAYIPCRMLGGRAPLQAYPEAGHTGRFYRPEWETELLDLKRVYAYLGACRWFRRVAQMARSPSGASTTISIGAAHDFMLLCLMTGVRDSETQQPIIVSPSRGQLGCCVVLGSRFWVVGAVAVSGLLKQITRIVPVSVQFAPKIR